MKIANHARVLRGSRSHCLPSMMPRSSPKTSDRWAGSCGRGRSVDHRRCRDRHGLSRLGSLRFSDDGCATAIACGHYPSIPTARANPWLTTNGISSWPRRWARSSTSRRRSSATASTALMSLAGPRQNGPWAHACWQRSRSATWLYDRRFQSAAQSAIILDQAADILPAPFAQRARDGAVVYRRLADRCAERAAIYAGRHDPSSRPVLCRSGDRTRLRGWSAAFRREGTGHGHGGRALGTCPQEGACDGRGRCGETMTRPLRLLFLLPFAPDLRGAHGGTRATAAIIDMLSQHHRLTVLYLAAPGDPPPRQLPANCERILAIPIGNARVTASAQQSSGTSGSRANCCGAGRNGSKNAGRRSWPTGQPQSPRSSSQTSSTTSSTSWRSISHSCARPGRRQRALSPNMNRGSSPTRSDDAPP